MDGDETLRLIQVRVLEWYERFGRSLPWRETRDAYRILVSELMLQQTQVSRVIRGALAKLSERAGIAS